MEEKYLTFIQFIKDHSKKEMDILDGFIKSDVEKNEEDISYANGMKAAYEHVFHFTNTFLEKEQE